eukprot:4295416-Amphidinium_carterae.1
MLRIHCTVDGSLCCIVTRAEATIKSLRCTHRSHLFQQLTYAIAATRLNTTASALNCRKSGYQLDVTFCPDALVHASLHPRAPPPLQNPFATCEVRRTCPAGLGSKQSLREHETEPVDSKEN